MPIVLVHGVPETDAIWDPLADHLAADHGIGDAVRLSPPGFGAPVPSGFEPNRLSYAAWLIGELEAIDGPIDVVGHDWGAGHVAGVMTTRPDLVRSWAIDVAGLLHPTYEWHDMAQLWRTPGVGEETIDGMMLASDDDKVLLLGSLGMPDDIAREVAEGWGETMGRCVLGLYRSADPEDLAPVWEALPTAAKRPGLVVLATADHYVGPLQNSIEVASHAGAATTTLEGLGHWWMLEDPAAAASALSDFWSGLG